MTTASELADALGRKTIADALDVLPTAVSNAVVRGWFPSSWFLAVKAIADAAGQECPPELFKMRIGATHFVDHPCPSGPTPTPIQDAGRKRTVSGAGLKQEGAKG